jgi:hypothetical protein
MKSLAWISLLVGKESCGLLAHAHRALQLCHTRYYKPALLPLRTRYQMTRASISTGSYASQ